MPVWARTVPLLLKLQPTVEVPLPADLPNVAPAWLSKVPIWLFTSAVPSLEMSNTPPLRLVKPLLTALLYTFVPVRWIVP